MSERPAAPAMPSVALRDPESSSTADRHAPRGRSPSRAASLLSVRPYHETIISKSYGAGNATGRTVGTVGSALMYVPRPVLSPAHLDDLCARLGTILSAASWDRYDHSTHDQIDIMAGRVRVWFPCQLLFSMLCIALVHGGRRSSVGLRRSRARGCLVVSS